MTPRKEIFIKSVEALKTIPEIELIALNRNQFNSSSENHPGCYTAVLIKSPTINYENMTENVKEGNAELELTLFVKDGWSNQHHSTEDINYGFVDVDLIDQVVNVMEFLIGDSFSEVQLILEEQDNISEDELMSYRLVFSTKIYKQIKYPYQSKKLKID